MYAVKNNQTGELFAGFDSEGAAIWTQSRPKAFATIAQARAQASLFRRFRVSAQAKPVAV